MSTPYTKLIRLIADGDPVNAAVTNRAPSDLANRTQHLKDILDALQASQLIQIPGVNLQDGMPLGTPVYLDIPTNTYRPALSTGGSQEVGNPASPQAFLAGVVVDNESGTSGTVGTFGRFVGLSLDNWADVVATGDVAGGQAIPGHYFLSSTQAGRMTRQPSGLGVYVGELNAEGAFYLRGGIPDYAAHTHHRFNLIPLPAVDDLDTDISQDPSSLRWTIDTPDSDQRGWLPASDADSDHLPPGIVVGESFFYNIDHPAEAPLRALFPPVPVDSWSAVQAGLVQPFGRIIVNPFGIWWTQNRNVGDEAAPWSDDVQANPGDEAEIEFWFSRILLPTDGGIVNSLRVHPGSAFPAELLDSGDNPAADGNLFLRLNPLPVEPGDESALAIKSLNGAASVGPVTTRVRGGAGIRVTGSGGDATAGWYGQLVLSLRDTILTQGNAASADLNNAREESIQGVRVVSLVAGRGASPSWTIQIPAAAPPTSDLALRFWTHFSVNEPLPTTSPLSLDYKIVPPVTSPTPIGPTFTPLTAFTDATTGFTSPRDGRYQVSQPFTIAGVPAGSVVVVRLNRSASDSHSGNIGIMRVDFDLT